MREEDKAKKIITLEDTDLRKLKHKFRSKEEAEISKEIQKRLVQMKHKRETSSPWPVPEEELSSLTTSVAGGSVHRNDWAVHWRRCERNIWMIAQYITGRSNLKASTSFAPAQAAQADFMNSNIVVDMEAEDDDDDGKVLAIKHRINYDINKHKLREVDFETYDDCKVYGTSIVYNCYTQIKKMEEFIIPKYERDKKARENPEEVQEKIKDGKPYTEEREVTKYEGLNKVRVNIFDFYVDPDALFLNGIDFSAKDCIWVKRVSVDSIKQELENSKDPYIIKENVKKIRSWDGCITEYESNSSLFELKDEFSDLDSDLCLVIMYFNKITNKHVILVNDIVIRNGILPYNHHELPFSIHKFKHKTGQFYGMGLATALEHTQGEAELNKNTRIEVDKVNAVRATIAHTDIYEDLTSQMQALEIGSVVEVTSEVTTGKLTQFPAITLTSDNYQIKEELNTEEVRISGVHPMTYSTPMANQPVRNNLMTQESTQRILKMSFMYWGAGLVDTQRQFIKLIKQYDPESMEPQKDGTYIGKKIKIQGYKLENDEYGNLTEKKIPGKSNFNMTPDIYDTKGEIEISLNLDSLVPPSKSVKVQNMDKAMESYVPIFAKSPQLLENPIFVDIMREHMKINDMPIDIINKLQTEDTDKERDEAYAENDAIERSVLEDSPILNIEGMPGRSQLHNQIHSYKLLELSQEKLEIMSTKPEQMINENIQDPVESEATMNEIMTQLMERDAQLTEIIKRLRDHMTVDAAPKAMLHQVAMQESMKLEPQSMPMQDAGGMPPEQMMMGGADPMMQGVGQAGPLPMAG